MESAVHLGVAMAGGGSMHRAQAADPRIQSQVWVLSITVPAFDERLTVSIPGSLSLPTGIGTLDY